MKRILCLISSMNAGGAETFLMKLYRNIDRTCYQMDFCVNVENEGFYEKEILSLGGKIYRIPTKSENLKEFKRQLFNLVKTEKYEYVLRITSNAAGFMDLKIAKKAGAAVCVARSSNSSDGDGLKYRVINRISRLLYMRYVDVKLAPSELAAEYTFGKGSVRKGRVSLLHNAVDLDQYMYSEALRNAVRQELNLGEKLVVGHIGRFNVQKNHAFLTDIFKAVKDRRENAVLLLVGTGALETQIRERLVGLGLEDSVVFAGVRSDIASLLSAMDVFVFPSFYEGMPNTVIEAQANGLPCVISDSITKEANITGLVRYLPLTDGAEIWADNAIAAVSELRKDTRRDFLKNGYDIDSTVKEFIRLVFASNDSSRK